MIIQEKVHRVPGIMCQKYCKNHNNYCNSSSSLKQLPFIVQTLNQQLSDSLVGQPFLSSFMRNLNRESQLSRSYQILKEKAAKNRVNIDNIMLYRALRYINRDVYERTKALNQPIEKAYQCFECDYQKPIEEQSTVIWDNWRFGSSREALILSKLENEPLGLDYVRKIHSDFYRYDDECGDHANKPFPGKLRQPRPFSEDMLWRAFPTEAAEHEAAERSRIINDEYKKLGFLPQSNLTFRGNDLNGVIKVIPGIGLFPGDTRLLEEHITLWLGVFNTYQLNICNGYPEISTQSPLWTPGEFALFMQRWLFQLQAFAEGNGRLSRLFQDILLKRFGLPYAASGDFMFDEALTLHADYYDRFMFHTSNLLQRISHCVDEVYPQYGTKVPRNDYSMCYDCIVLSN